MKAKLISDAGGILESSGYRVLDCSGLRSCFDLIARGDRIILVKVLSNIEGLTRRNADELKQVASMLSAFPVVLGLRMKSSELNRGVIYARYGLHVFSLDTFEDLFNERHPLVYSVRGNYCVGIDPSLLLRLRRKLSWTQEELAANLGVSKQTVHRYELSGRVSLEVAERLIDLLEDNIVVPQEVFSPSLDESFDVEVHLTDIKRMVLEKFRSLGLSSAATNAPFDIVSSGSSARILTTVSDDSRRLRLKIELVEAVSDLIGAYCFCISNRREDSDVVLMRPRDLEDIRDQRELYRLFI